MICNEVLVVIKIKTNHSARTNKGKIGDKTSFKIVYSVISFGQVTVWTLRLLTFVKGGGVMTARGGCNEAIASDLRELG